MSVSLSRRFGLLQATALNMSNMIGIGPFITIPILMSALGGPQAMLGWLVAVLVIIPDGLVWSELGAAMPGSGGSYVYLREAYGRERVGRLVAFLFIWQFILSGPLEIASGYIGFSRYARYIWPDLTSGAVFARRGRRRAAQRRPAVSPDRGDRHAHRQPVDRHAPDDGAVIVSGALHFDAARAFDFPPGAFDFSIGFLLGLGAASRVGIYDYLGYYDVCYIGDEVKDPGRVIPRSILISIAAVAVLYLAINLSIIGVVPWREFVPADAHPESEFIVSTFMERLYGTRVATVFTFLILWTAFGSVFALLLGYSRIPYAAARDGYFFSMFGRLHPTARFPHVSLVVLGVISIVCSLLPLGLVIDALITTRILVQFIGQVFAVMLLRAKRPDVPRPFRMWLYPLPALVALAGWIFLLLTSGWLVDRVRPRHARPRYRVLPHLVVAHAPLAVSGAGSSADGGVMKRLAMHAIVLWGVLLAAAAPLAQPASQRTQAPSTDGKLNIIAFGAHPDDCDQRAGGIAAKYAALGHRVRFVAVTNGDAGHQTEGGGALAARRRAEAQEAGRRIGIEYVVLDNHDGELVPSVEVARIRSSGRFASGTPTSCSRRGRTTIIPTIATRASSCRMRPTWSSFRTSHRIRRHCARIRCSCISRTDSSVRIHSRRTWRSRSTM